jgi:L-malate glycosyltransferase
VLRVVHLVDNLRAGGTELHVLKLTRALRARGIDVRLVLIGESGILEQEYAGDGVTVEKQRVGSFQSMGLPSRLRAIARAVFASRPHVVHAHDRYSNLVAALLPRPANHCPLFIASQRWGMPSSVGWRIASRVSFARADLITANGTGTLDIARSLALHPSKVVAVPNFLENECFPDGPARSARAKALRESLPVPISSATVLLGSVGRLEKVKRVDWQLRLTRRLLDDGHDVGLIVVGEGSERARLEALKSQLALESRVFFLGHLPRLPLPHAAFDVALLTSSSEGTPNSIVESMACGVPCVATNVGGVSGVVQDGTTGLLVDVGDESAMLAAASRLVTDDSLRESFGRNARGIAKTRWHEAVVVPQLLSLYAAR